MHMISLEKLWQLSVKCKVCKGVIFPSLVFKFEHFCHPLLFLILSRAADWLTSPPSSPPPLLTPPPSLSPALWHGSCWQGIQGRDYINSHHNLQPIKVENCNKSCRKNIYTDLTCSFNEPFTKLSLNIYLVMMFFSSSLSYTFKSKLYRVCDIFSPLSLIFIL